VFVKEATIVSGAVSVKTFLNGVHSIHGRSQFSDFVGIDSIGKINITVILHGFDPAFEIWVRNER
jgi:hypothetical protein